MEKTWSENEVLRRRAAQVYKRIHESFSAARVSAGRGSHEEFILEPVYWLGVFIRGLDCNTQAHAGAAGTSVTDH